MKYLLTLIFTFTIALTAAAQSDITLTGTVRDAKGHPVSHARVAVENSSQGTLTKTDGHYSFKTGPGKQVIVVTAIGFDTVRRRVELTESMTLDFTITENPVLLKGVNVVRQSAKARTLERVYAASNLDVQPITASLNNLTSLVNRTSGIRIREEGGVGSDFNLSINGLSGNAVRYFIDGVPLSVLGEGVSLANLPINLVDRIEVFKGVVPADMGADALGGVINIITRRHRTNYADLSIGGGSFSTAKADFNAQYVLPKYGLTIRPTLGFNYSKNNYIMRDVEVWDEEAYSYVPMDKRRFHDGYKSGLGRLELGLTDRSWADEAFVSIAFSGENKEIQTGQKQTIVIGEATREKKSTNLTARYSKHNFLTENLSVLLTASYTADHMILNDTAYKLYSWDAKWVNSSFSEVTGRGKSVRHYERPQLVVRSNINYFFNEQSSLNLNYLLQGMTNKRYDDYDEQFLPTNDRLDKHIIGLSYNHHFRDNRLNATAFVKDYIFHTKLEQQDFYWITGINDVPTEATRNNVGYGLGVRYTIVPAIAIKASYEKGVRLPTAREFLGNGETIYPNLKLRPESAHNVNVGAYGEWRMDETNVLRYETNFFLRMVKDYIYRTIIGDRESQYDNVGSATVKGVEGEISYEHNDLFRLAVNATRLDERNKQEHTLIGSPNITYNNRMPNRPWVYANAEASFNFINPFGVQDHRLKVEWISRYIHWFYLSWEAFGSKASKAVIPTQFSNDAVATWYFKDDRYALSLECSNLFDRKLYDNYMLQKPGRAFFGKFRLFIK